MLPPSACLLISRPPAICLSTRLGQIAIFKSRPFPTRPTASLNSLIPALRAAEPGGWNVSTDILVADKAFAVSALKRLLSKPPDFLIDIGENKYWVVCVGDRQTDSVRMLQTAINEFAAPVNLNGKAKVSVPLATGIGVEGSAMSIATAVSRSDGWSIIYLHQERFLTKDEVAALVPGGHPPADSTLLDVGPAPVSIVAPSSSSPAPSLMLLSTRIDSSVLEEFRELVRLRNHGKVKDAMRQEVEAALKERSRTIRRELGMAVDVKTVDWRRR